jgi:branched-chain amino acid transport system permease protein
MNLVRNPGLWLAIGLTALVGVLPAVTHSDANREVVYTILMFMVLATSLNLLMGYTGYVNFGHIVFFGLGGYFGFYLMSAWNVSLFVAILSGGLFAMGLALLVGTAILRLRGAYFALATIGINEAARAFVSNFAPFGGPTGMSLNFQVYSDYGGPRQALWLVYWLVLSLALVGLLISYMVKSSKFGLGLMAIRENEDAAEVMGVVTPRMKTLALGLSALLPGMIGVLFFFKNGTIEPVDAFRLNTSIEIIVMVMLGGYGTVLGPLLGAAGYERLRGLLLVSPFFKNIQVVVAGILLLVIVLFIPAGVVGWLRRRIPLLRRIIE